MSVIQILIDESCIILFQNKFNDYIIYLILISYEYFGSKFFHYSWLLLRLGVKWT